MISHNWSPMKRLIWLRGSGITGGSGTYETVTGNPVSFTAKAAPLRKLEVAFSPVQDLHGYDAPWPAGGGKNKLNIDASEEGGIDASGTLVEGNNLWRATDYIPVTVGTTYTFGATSPTGTGLPDIFNYRIYYYSSSKVFVNRVETTTNPLVFTVPENISYIKWTIRCASGSFTESIVKAYKLQIEAGSALTSFAPYSNECPISGWSSLTVEQRGKNLFDGTYEPWGVSADKIASTNGRTAIVPIKGGEKYTINKIGSSNRSVYYEAYETPTVGTSVVKIGETAIPVTVTTSANAKYLVIYVSTSSEQAEPQMTVVLGETASDYVAYDSNSQTISISLGSTVYSGYVDVVTGVGTVTHASETFDGTEAWGREALLYDTARFFLGKNEMKKYVDYTSFPYILFSNRMPTVQSYSDFAGTKYLAVTGYSITSNLQNYVYVMSHYAATGIETVDQLKAWLANNPLQVCYELATPIPIQLTPQEVQSLLGENVLFSDANGDLTVEYRSN